MAKALSRGGEVRIREFLSKTNGLADLLQAFFGRGVFLKRVPTTSHRHGEVELAAADVFHSGGVRLEGWWSSVRRPHQDHERRERHGASG